MVEKARRVLRFVATGIIIGITMPEISTCNAAPETPETPLVLENPHIAVKIDRRTGALRSIRDKEQDVAYPVSGIGFVVTTGTGSIQAEKAVEARTKQDAVELRFAGSGLDITLHYHLGDEDRFVEKWLEIKASDGKPYFLDSVVLEDMNTGAFREIHFHDDQTIWHCPVNLFLRGDKGGCFAGIAYPYWDLTQRGKEGFRLGYTPNYPVKQGEVNVSEKYFIGVYRNEGIFRLSQGPYPGRGRYPLMGHYGGLSQHFRGGIPDPVEDVPVEVLDWGEVWAMQAFMRHVLPDEYSLPEEGYWVWQNGWWARLWDLNSGALDILEQAGIHDVMTAHTWYGRGIHPLTPPYLGRMRSNPMGFPKDSGVAGLPGPEGNIAALHADHSGVQLDKFFADAFTSEFVAPPAMEDFHAYGRKIGVHVSSFSLPIVYFENHPEWAALSEDGTISEYLFGRKLSCPACDPFMEQMLSVLDHVITKYKPRYWGFDGRWLSYWELAGYRPGSEGAGFDPCYADNHGHLPGANLYKEWKNIEKLLRELRRRHPTLCIDVYYGMHRGRPWSLRYFNAVYPYFETEGILANRFQAWHLQNGQFSPVYKNTCDLFDTEPREFEMNMITATSMSSSGMMGPAFKGLHIKENRDCLKKWRAWATKNYDYLKVKRDLFDCPGQLPLDGSAHIIKDRGFLFLFPVTGDNLRASIPLNRWLQLEENPDALYRIQEVHPREGTDLGVYRYGDTFLYDLAGNSPVVLSLEPAPGKAQPVRNMTPLPDHQVITVEAFPAPNVTVSENVIKATSPAGTRIGTLGTSLGDATGFSYALAPTGDANAFSIPAGTSELVTAAPLEEGTHTVSITATKGSLTFTSDVEVDVLSSNPPPPTHAWTQKDMQGPYKDGGNINLASTAMGGAVTVVMRVRPDRLTGDDRLIGQLADPASTRSTLAGALSIGPGGSLRVWTGAAWSELAAPGTIHVGRAVHLAFVWKRGSVQAHVDGQAQLTATANFDFGPSNGNLGIGAPFLGQYGNAFQGQIDEIAIYDSALPPFQIENLAKAEPANPPPVQR